MKRYPGIQSFDADRRHLFFGRDRETKELFRLAVLHPIVVLFGKSGTGKTSLIQAGVTPLLHQRRLHPVFLRLNQTQTSIPQQIHAILDEGEYLPYNTPNDLTLWDYCHRFAYDESGDSFTPLFVLDQFEELFTLYADKPDEQKRFITQLAQVMNGTAPEGSRRTTPPKAHFLISIRSDYLYLLDRLSDQIPAILRIRYELYDLDIANAQQAIEQPALAKGTFDSPPFAYSPDALQDIINELSQEQTGTERSRSNTTTQTREVGGFQLQLLCQRIEQKIMLVAPILVSEEELVAPIFVSENTPLIITPEFYGGSQGIRQIIGEFYDSVLHQYPKPDTRRHIQQLLEEGLISNQRRIILEENHIKSSYQITQADLDLLTRERLCRKESRANLWYYEISHDTLLKPIIAAYELRREAEEKLRLAEEKAEAERKAAEIAQQAARDRELRQKAEAATRRSNIFAIIAGIVAVLALVLGSFAMQQRAKAVKQTQIAEQKQQEAETNLRKFKEEEANKIALQIKEWRDKALRAQQAKETQFACDLWQQILSIDINNQEAKQQIKLCK